MTQSSSGHGSPSPQEIEGLIASYGAGRHDQAELQAQELIHRHPAHPFSWKVLGYVQAQTGRLEQALATLERAAALAPLDKEIANMQGNVLCGLGRKPAACDSYRRALAIDPRDVNALNNLAATLQELGHSVEAQAFYRQALELMPGNAEIHYNLANALLESGAQEEAEAQYLQTLRLQQNHLGALSNLGVLLKDAGRFADAEECFRYALKLKPDSPDLLANLGRTLRDAGLQEPAAKCFEAGLAIDPRHAHNLIGKGYLEFDIGHFAAAEAYFKSALTAKPMTSEALAALADLRRMDPTDVDWLAAATQALAQVQPVRDEVRLRFALGKYYDDVGDFDRAFEHYTRANALKRQRGRRYSRQQWEEEVDQLIEDFPIDRLRQQHAGASDSCRPVLVVGMPRSGTSLIEQIIASHPCAFGAGELTYWGTTLQSAARQPLALDEPSVRKLAAGYLQVLSERSVAAERVVDKMPANYSRLAPIHIVFPNARIIHVRRDPLDTCLSIYCQNFNASHPYANDLADLAFHYQHYHRLMKHWRLALPAETFLEIDYEGLLDDQELWTRRIVDFLNLEWSDSCLRFHDTQRKVATASNWQVRQAIYTSSRARWRHYERFLAPLLELRELTP
jgi:tetratricopeptide (TPR) repeat protein